ncbi:MAG TPA: TonB-dependent receptor [Acidimicrobiia bacterium]|jgi:outer membrane receptor protein involved in Fe transport|nr:TonB-dependent receptor [Acidimicrobiia bacterium]
MSTKHLLIAGLGLAGFATGSLVHTREARAQSATTGAIQGQVKDEKAAPIAGVTVIITSPSLAQTQTALTDENGVYKIADLPPGDYLITFYYQDSTIEKSGIHVGIEKTVPVFQTIDTSKVGGEVIKVVAKTPTIDPTSTNQGITIDKNYLKNIPVPGRTFEAALGAAAGSQNDGVGVSFSGSSSLENQYIVDGVNTTGLTYGTVGTPVINDFIEEIEVITGGYNAEYGRATGGVVNVVTKSGSNELKGSVFGYWSPGQLTANAKSTPINSSSIDTIPNLNYQADFGFELGGPIIKDKLWFFVGFAPAFSQTDIYRFTKTLTDCRSVLPNGQLSSCDGRTRPLGGNADGVPDVDPKTGFFITDVIDSDIRSQTQSAYNILSKINYAATPENQGQLTFQALPSSQHIPNVFGPADQGAAINQSDLTTDLSGKWTSKFNDNKTEIEAIVGWHRDYVKSDAINPAFEDQAQNVLTDGVGQAANLGVWGAGFKSESQRTIMECTNGSVLTDAMGNPVSGALERASTNCPMSSRAYVVGGPGGLQRDREERRSARLGITERFKAAGSHEVKAGVDIEDNISEKARLYTGGQYDITDQAAGVIEMYRWAQLTGANNTDPRFDNTCTTPNPADVGKTTLQFSPMPSTTKGIVYRGKCDFLSGTIGSPGTTVLGNTLNWAAYLRDSWQIKPNLTFNYGVRYEEQRLRYADFLQNTQDALTGNFLGKNAMVLQGNFAPRIGLIYDPTKEGRAKIYANWGRFYESIPMDINERSFGGEVQYFQQFSSSGTGNQCGTVDPRIGAPDPAGCLFDYPKTNPPTPPVADVNNSASRGQQLIGASGDLVAPGIKAQYMDEILGGLEYEVLDDLKIGVTYQNRQLGRVIEDVSTDGANTYIISNPGEWSTDDEKNLENQIDRTTDATDKARLQHELTLFRGIRIFDHPTRDYNALQFTLTRRFSKHLYVQGSYTYSKTEGNYPGLISYGNGQIDPNISSQFDLIELLANHEGPLPTDRPHYIKIDGYYTFDFKQKGSLTLGIRFRALSGIPENALGAHYLYGENESYLLPQGELGRTDFTHGLDVHAGYGKALPRNMNLEVFFDIFNIYNAQGTFYDDDTYAPLFRINGGQQAANPISGGTYQDLIWTRTIVTQSNEPVETPTPISRNPNFHNTIVRYAPASARIGVRLTF